MAQKVLAVDDSPDTHRLLEAPLKEEGIELFRAEDADSALALARQIRPDLILLDVDTPGTSGLEVCRTLRDDAVTSLVPVIVLTGPTQLYAELEGFALGAVDYVKKPIEPAELQARVRSALRTKRGRDLLVTRPEIDDLTGLWDRAHFDRRLAELLLAAKNASSPMALLMFDLDHFASINDGYGHPFGDRVLQCVGELLALLVPEPAVACRYGGEEFAMLVPGASSAAAASLALKIMAELRKLGFTHDGHGVRVTTSVGVTTTESFPLDGDTAQRMLSAADEALFSAKAAGRDRVVVADRPSCSESLAPPSTSWWPPSSGVRRAAPGRAPADSMRISLDLADFGAPARPHISQPPPSGVA